MKQGTQPSTAEAAVPEPRPPVRWLRRLVKITLVLAVILAALRWWWGYEAHQRFLAEIQRLRAAGRPVLPEDFDHPQTPDDDNMALMLTEAAEAMDITAEQTELLSDIDKLVEASPEQWQELADFSAANTELRDLVRRARSATGCDWGIRFRPPVINMLLPHLRTQRSLARAIRGLALHEHRVGRNAESVVLLRDLLHQAEALDRGSLLISHLVAGAVTAVGVETIEYVLPDLQVGNPPAADRGELEALIDQLLQDQLVQQGFLQAMDAERMMLLDVVRLAAGGQSSVMSAGWGATMPPSIFERILLYPIRPVFELDGIEISRHLDAVARAVEQPWPVAQAELQARANQAAADMRGLGRITRPLSRLFLASYERAALANHRVRAQRRMAAVALAIKLHELDHGQRPQQLAELMPRYLSEVPADPLATAGVPIGYRPHAALPLLYSVGDNGMDEGGAYEWDERAERIDRHKHDLVFFLDGRPALGQGAEDQDHEGDEQRNADQDQGTEQQQQGG